MPFLAIVQSVLFCPGHSHLLGSSCHRDNFRIDSGFYPSQCKITPSFFYLKFCQMFFKNTFYIFIYYFLLVAVLIPSMGRTMYLFPKIRIGNFYWWPLMSHLTLRNYFLMNLWLELCHIFILSLHFVLLLLFPWSLVGEKRVWWCITWKVYLLGLLAPCYLSIIILAFYYISFLLVLSFYSWMFCNLSC